MDAPDTAPFYAAPLSTGGRVEIGGVFGAVVNDPFMRTSLAGATLAWQPVDRLGLEVQVFTATLKGDNDCQDPRWKELLVRVLCEGNGLRPDPHFIAHMGNAGLSFTPLKGDIVMWNRLQFGLGVYIKAGFGVVAVSDGDIIYVEEEPVPETLTWRPTTDVATGFQLALVSSIIVRVEAHKSSYIDLINSTTLEMKGNLIGQVGVSVLLGRVQE